MQLARTDEQSLLYDTAARFIAERYDFASRQRAIREDFRLDRAQWREFADLGWLGLPLAEAAGGYGGSLADLGALMEAFGGGPLIEPYVPAVVLCAELVARLGTAGQRRRLLPAVVAGDLILALAHGERRPRAALATVATTACRADGGWRLNGGKILVSGGYAADELIVSARLAGGSKDRTGIGLFLVKAEAPGIRRHNHATLDGGAAADFTFDNVALAADALLGDAEDTFDTLEAVIDRAIVAMAWQAIGSAQALLEATVDYTRTRHQFGRPLSSNQALRHRVADMSVALIEARALTLSATLQIDAGAADLAQLASAVKYKVATAARVIAEGAVQFHGGVGMTEDLPVGDHYKSIMAFAILFGSPDTHLRRFGARAFAGASSQTEA